MSTTLKHAVFKGFSFITRDLRLFSSDAFFFLRTYTVRSAQNMQTRSLTRSEHTYVNVRKKNASLENSLYCFAIAVFCSLQMT